MGYFDYHKTAKKLIQQGKLIESRILDEYNGISPALLLIFDDASHPVMPIRKEKWHEYMPLLKTKPKNYSDIQLK